MFCTILNRLFTAIPTDDTKSEWTPIMVDLAGNMTNLSGDYGTFDTEEEAEAVALAHRSMLLDFNSQFGVGA